MRVHLQALGCRLNEAELESWSRDFRALGYELTKSAADADLIVVNSCAVTRESVKKSRNLIRRSQRENPLAKLVMSGCYAALSPEQAAADLGVDLVVPNSEKDNLAEIARRELALPTMPAMAMEPGETTLLARGRHRAFIKVQDGCRYRCTFCIVTVARGAERSRPIPDIIEDIKLLHEQGIQEVVLAGVHLGGYGSDIQRNLKELIEAVLDNTRIPRIRLGSLEPWDLPTGFWQLFSNPRLMPHLHLPLQSGANSVLRRMARRCRIEQFAELVKEAREQVADFNITTDIIVGFPGETAEEWRQTQQAVEQLAFGHIHIFAYSAREGTKAAHLPEQLDRDIKRGRSQQLHLLAGKSRYSVLRKNIGRVFEVLIEGKSKSASPGQSKWSGYTPNYLRINIEADESAELENQLITVRATAINADGDALIVEPML